MIKKDENTQVNSQQNITLPIDQTCFSPDLKKAEKSIRIMAPVTRSFN